MRASPWLAAFLAAACGCGGNGSSEGTKQPTDVAAVATAGVQSGVESASSEPGPSERLVVGADPCKADEDCAPATCCHPRACVAKSAAPHCDKVPCTLNCIGGTMDCGGRCLCHEGKCAAKLAPSLVVPPPQP